MDTKALTAAEIDMRQVSPSGESYLRLQYQSLRTEIDYLTKILMQFQAVSVTAIPVVIGSGTRPHMEPLLYAAPVITVVFALMLLFLQDSIMRAGEFIRTELEPRLLGDDEPGWEGWLETYPRNRTAESYFAWSAHIAFSLYYVGGTILACVFLHERLGEWNRFAYVAGAVYAGFFAVCLFTLVKNLRTNTCSNRQASYNLARRTQ